MLNRPIGNDCIHLASFSGRLIALREFITDNISNLNMAYKDCPCCHDIIEKYRQRQVSFRNSAEITATAIASIAIAAFGYFLAEFMGRYDEEAQLSMHLSVLLVAVPAAIGLSIAAICLTDYTIFLNMDDYFLNLNYKLDNWTPLHFAIISGKTEIVNELLCSGADTRILADDHRNDFSRLLEYYTGVLGYISRHRNRKVNDLLPILKSYEERFEALLGLLSTDYLMELSLEQSMARYTNPKKQRLLAALKQSSSLHRADLSGFNLSSEEVFALFNGENANRSLEKLRRQRILMTGINPDYLLSCNKILTPTHLKD